MHKSRRSFLDALIASENVHKVYPISSGFLTLVHMGIPFNDSKSQNFMKLGHLVVSENIHKHKDSQDLCFLSIDSEIKGSQFSCTD